MMDSFCTRQLSVFKSVADVQRWCFRADLKDVSTFLKLAVLSVDGSCAGWFNLVTFYYCIMVFKDNARFLLSYFHVLRDKSD